MKNLNKPIMPKALKNNFLFREFWKNVHYKNKNCGLIVVGQTGSGKSAFALRLAEMLDPTFNVAERVIFRAEDFLDLLNSKDLKKGSVIIFDECIHSEGASSRESMSKNNKILGYVSSIYRALGLVVIFVLPSLNQLDKSVRQVSISGVFRMQTINYARQKSAARFYWNDLNCIMGEAYLKRPHYKNEDGEIIKLRYTWLSKPSDVVWDEYEMKKMKFIRMSLSGWQKDFADRKTIKEKKRQPGIAELAVKVRAKKDEFMANNSISAELIMAKFKVGVDKGRSIKKLVDMGG